MRETIRLEDMRLFASVAEAQSFSGAARSLGIPKQTISRRIAELERALGVGLMNRTTRRLKLTDAGAAYAARCADIVRLAEEANRAASDVDEVPRGTLRLTADPVFGEAFVAGLVTDYAARWSETRVEVVLTRRHVDLVEERFDVAFRIGRPDDATLTGIALGAARVRFCASPEYVARRGAPSTAEDLANHDCIVTSDGGTARWPLLGERAPKLVAIAPRLAFTSFAMAHAAAVAGLGVALFPEFACADDLRRKRLVQVLGTRAVDVGSVWLLYPAQRFLPARVRAFVDLARERFAATRPWEGRARREDSEEEWNMSYDENLATRIRALLSDRDDVVEKKMFGGLCFTVAGAMCCGLTKTDLMVRVGPDQYDAALAEPHARPMDFTGRPLAGMVYVGPKGLRHPAVLAKWVGRGVDFVSSLPAKTGSARPSKAFVRPSATDRRMAALLRELRSVPALAPIVEAFESPQAATRRKFGSNGLKVEGKLFALFTQGTLVVKLPRERVAALMASRTGKPFDPGHGRLMKEWLAVTSVKASWVELAKEAHDFVRQGRR